MIRPFAAASLVVVLGFASIWQGAPPRAAAPTERRSLARVLAGLPARNAGRGGKPGDPVNLLLVGSRASIEDAFEAAGWSQVDTRNQVSFFQGLADLATEGRFKRFPPMHAYYLDGRPQELNFAIVTSSIFSRHHFRLWRLPYLDPGGRPMWWGTGDYDVALRWSDLSHVTDPDMGRERDYIGRSLAGRAGWLALIPLAQIPRSGEDDKGYPFRTDGRVLLAELAR